MAPSVVVIPVAPSAVAVPVVPSVVVIPVAPLAEAVPVAVSEVVARVVDADKNKETIKMLHTTI